MTRPRMTIEAELSHEGLLELRDAIDSLLAEIEGPRNPFVEKARQEQAERKVREVWSRVGDNIKTLLAVAAVDWPEGSEFSMNDLAERLDKNPKTVRSWHRNLGRSLRVVDQHHPEPPLLESRWDGSRNLYRLLPEVRDAILRRDVERAR